jgi:tetratricopeptide (TPR) repeat protein
LQINYKIIEYKNNLFKNLNLGIFRISIMKKYQTILIATLLIGGGFIFYAKHSGEINQDARDMLKNANFLTVCDETLYYSLGEVDSRFEISQDELINVLAQAENVWEKDLNRNVLEYREGATFKINLVFDSRQQQTIEKNKLDSQLDRLEAIRGNLSDEYQSLQNKYDKLLTEYKKDLKTYEKTVAIFNKKVNDWNKKGGASEDEYEKLKEEEDAITKLKKDLELQRKVVNKLIADMNNLAQKENGLVDAYNNKIKTYKDTFGEGKEFDQGVYNGVGINVYQFHDKSDLELVLVHELGHALGLNHLENPESVMYYLMEKQNLENIKLTAQDLQAIKDVCRIE